MFKEFLNHIRQHQLCSSDDKILVAVSGGVDSMVMLHLLHRAGFSLAIAHCNFNLRGRESDNDEKFVREQAEIYHIPVHVKNCNASLYAKDKKISIEMAARHLRYAWFESLLTKHHFQKLAVGHHRDDDAETFFIKLLRGSGLDGLKSILPARDVFIRPLLFASREEIMTYAQKHHLPFREDSSNDSDDFLRNRIRHHLLPFFEKEFPGSQKALAESLKKLKETDAVFNQLIDEKKENLFIREKTAVHIKKEKLLFPSPQKAWFYFLLREFHFNRQTTDNIFDVLQSEQTGQLFYSDTHVLLNDAHVLQIKKRAEMPDDKVYLVHPGKPLKKPISLSFTSLLKKEVSSLFTTEKEAIFDQEKLRFPLKLRHWQKGDRFSPFGMKGSKLLSDFFTDEKINRFLRDEIWLLTSGDEIIWVIGYRTSEKFRVTDKTQTILKITWHP